MIRSECSGHPMDGPKPCQACPQGQEETGADKRPPRPGGRRGRGRCLPDRRSFVPRAAPGGGLAPKEAGDARPFRVAGGRRRRGPRRARSRRRERPRCGTPASRARARRPAPGRARRARGWKRKAPRRRAGKAHATARPARPRAGRPDRAAARRPSACSAGGFPRRTRRTARGRRHGRRGRGSSRRRGGNRTERCTHPRRGPERCVVPRAVDGWLRARRGGTPATRRERGRRGARARSRPAPAGCRRRRARPRRPRDEARGRAVSRAGPFPTGRLPVAEWIRRHLGRLARGSAPGRIVEIRRASMVLPAPGGPDEKHVVPAGRGDLERPPRHGLAADVGEVDAAGSGGGGAGRERDFGSRGDGWLPERNATVSDTVRTGSTSSPSTQAASVALASRQDDLSNPASRAARARDSALPHGPDLAVQSEALRRRGRRRVARGSGRQISSSATATGRSRAAPTLLQALPERG